MTDAGVDLKLAFCIFSLMRAPVLSASVSGRPARKRAILGPEVGGAASRGGTREVKMLAKCSWSLTPKSRRRRELAIRRFRSYCNFSVDSARGKVGSGNDLNSQCTPRRLGRAGRGELLSVALRPRSDLLLGGNSESALLVDASMEPLTSSSSSAHFRHCFKNSPRHLDSKCVKSERSNFARAL